MPRSPRGHFLRAAELRTLVQAPSTVKYRKDPPAPIKCDFSNERLQYCVDIAVLEVGLGGRLDCTNVLTPEVSVITTIGLDHTEILGDTLEAIAFEKAGIIKPGVPVVTAMPDSPAPRVIEFPTDGGTAFAHLYPPQNADFEGPDGERPPLVVWSHGGPTSESTQEFNLGVSYFTTLFIKGVVIIMTVALDSLRKR